VRARRRRAIVVIEETCLREYRVCIGVIALGLAC
jgi:hypothetical protein